ncbi:YciI family protein [Saccharomonospora sp. NB11]|uniref:YciI family protein n=1 Tax=Saccharomonospora sp. NB11 TaxID=1642298 RepID=UPI0018D0A21F|nr:YciI family protein [Saccharomonospora sp. NB11]
MTTSTGQTVLHVLHLHYTGTEAAAAPFVTAHVDYLRRYHDAGTFLVSGQTVPTSDGGVIVAGGVDREAVEAITRTDPFVIAGVGRYSITTITAGRTHPALAELLDQR